MKLTGIRVKKLGWLKAGPDLLAGEVREGFSEEVTSTLKTSQGFLSQRRWMPGQVIWRVYRAGLSKQMGSPMTGVRRTERQPVKFQPAPKLSAHCHLDPGLWPSPHRAHISLYFDKKDTSLLLPPGSGAIPSVRLSSCEERTSRCL